MKKKFLLAFCCSLAFTYASAQYNDESILMTIGDRQITKGEFVRIYKKNNPQEPNDQKSVKQYLDLFVNFKLKVIEAENLKMDTSASFRNELSGYRKQLAKPYLMDKKVLDSLAMEAYDRMRFELNTSHILMLLEPNASPKDTLLAYQKIIKIRNRLLKGEDFGTIASILSEDKSAKINKGDLGYITAFQTIYPFETAAYRQKPGEISMPVRTKFGYHLIKVKDRRPNQGQIKVAHIMLAVPKDASPDSVALTTSKIQNLYKQLKEGADFTKLAKQYSIERRSAEQGGVLPLFTTGDMIPEFEIAAFALKNVGDISEPVQTPFGWHIIKLLEKKPMESFDVMQNDIRSKIKSDERDEKGKIAVVNRLKTELNFKMIASLKDYVKFVDKSIFIGQWDAAKAKTFTGDLFTLQSVKYSKQAFTKYLAETKLVKDTSSVQAYINAAFDNYISDIVLKIEEDGLESKFTDFKYLIREYHDGILLFELTDKMVWSKAISDTLGLARYYDKIKSNHLQDERFDLSIYKYNEPKTTVKVQKVFDKQLKTGLSPKEIINLWNVKTKDSIRLEVGKIFSKGTNQVADSIFAKKDIFKETLGQAYYFIPSLQKIVLIHKYYPIEPKPLGEVRGIVTSEYQNFLEKEWIERLKAKYPVKVNQAILSTIN
jgi:peptidyl-prolyl cis-trans isomerase SurA